MKQIKFSADEAIVMLKIEHDGEFLWNSVEYPKLKAALKELMWRELIERKQQGGLCVNVFVPTELGKHAISHNNACKILNSK